MLTQSHITTRRRFEVRGRVQGVGFRPFVHRLAQRLHLAGSVSNTSGGATIEIEGAPDAQAAFEVALFRELPPLAHIAGWDISDLACTGDARFEIVASQRDAVPRAAVTPDAATCADCRRELFDTRDRRHRYPLTNCTNCGPRYSIIHAIPYDRPATTMASFEMCPVCAREYDDPADRRFHAQPVACHACGPKLQLVDRAGEPLPGDPIRVAAAMLVAGRIIAIKGLGGFHLACRADDGHAVRTLRKRKIRDGKPFALMVPDLDAAERLGALTAADRRALESPAAPIVLAPRRADAPVAAAIAPDCRDLGTMLPYTPIHLLLFAEGLGPLVMTSANRAGLPLTYRNDDALRELADIADAILLHDRDIFRPIDDSVIFTFRDAAIPIRRARGFVPEPLALNLLDNGGVARRFPPILAVGAELKSTLCLAHDHQAIVSEHLGDLTAPETYRHYVTAIDRLSALYDFAPACIAHDEHPRYLSTEYATSRQTPRVAVQHHHAHIASVMAEHQTAGPVLGLACDGVGYGSDGAIWGCELLRCERGDYTRLGHLRYFPLLGGDLAARETWRPAAALLWQAFGAGWRRMLDSDAPELAARFARVLDDRRATTIDQQLELGANCPPTSSLGRVFDAIAFLAGVCDENRHEAEAAMALEAAVEPGDEAAPPFPFEVLEGNDQSEFDISPMIRAIAYEIADGASASNIAARFHETLARLFAAALQRTAGRQQTKTVALSGGCFANRRLLARTVELLETVGYEVLYNRQVPAGDGGIALGQAFVAAWRLAESAADTYEQRSRATIKAGEV